jgi:hypothetical protein
VVLLCHLIGAPFCLFPLALEPLATVSNRSFRFPKMRLLCGTLALWHSGNLATCLCFHIANHSLGNLKDLCYVPYCQNISWQIARLPDCQLHKAIACLAT